MSTPNPKPSTCPICGYHQIMLHDPEISYEYAMQGVNEYKLILHCPYCRKPSTIGLFSGTPEVRQ